MQKGALDDGINWQKAPLLRLSRSFSVVGITPANQKRIEKLPERDLGKNSTGVRRKPRRVGFRDLISFGLYDRNSSPLSTG